MHSYKSINFLILNFLDNATLCRTTIVLGGAVGSGKTTVLEPMFSLID
ncbi:hypothetical protein QUF50_05445 [Thiotrichales bacterium HSG1]|nr:hypothetical protein [Thiotrichales bacterium HSG1]